MLRKSASLHAALSLDPSISRSSSATRLLFQPSHNKFSANALLRAKLNRALPSPGLTTDSPEGNAGFAPSSMIIRKLCNRLQFGHHIRELSLIHRKLFTTSSTRVKMATPKTENAVGKSTDICAGFFYGTLMVPQIFYSVCYNTIEPPKHIQDRHTFHPAILHGHCRKRIHGVDYPGMIVDPEKSVRGTVVTGLSKANIKSLDFFEGSEYERRQVKPNILTKVGNAQGDGNEEGEEVIADTYIFMNHADLSVEGGEWDFEEFCRDKMQKWTRAGYVFEDCDPNQPATVAAAT